MDYTTVVLKIIVPIIILFCLVYFLPSLYFSCQRKKFVVWAEEQYAVLISNNSNKSSLILTILSNDIKIDKLSGLLDNEKVFDINSGEEENIIDIFNRPYSMPKYLFLRDESVNHKKEVVKDLIIDEYHRYLEDLENRPKTPLFLVTSYKGTFWKKIKSATKIPFIKVLGLKKI